MKADPLPDLNGARVLAIRLDSMGDVLMTGPALQSLKERFPASHLTLLTSESGAVAARHLPCVDEIVIRAVPWMKSAPDAETRWDADLDALIGELRGSCFDVAIIFTVYSQSALPAAFLCTHAGIPTRLAFCRENPYHLLSHWIKEPEPHQTLRHEVRRQLDLAEVLAGTLPDRPLALAIPEPSYRAVLEMVTTGMPEIAAAISSPEPSWAVVHPGATAASRRYPPERFAQVIARLYRHGITTILTGSTGEQALIDTIREQAGCPSHSLAGRLSFPELAALIDLAPLIICNNTGPSHIAAAMQTPVVCLYALTNPQHTPWLVPSRVLHREVPCRNCYQSVCLEPGHPCLAGVSDHEVATAALDLLSRTPSTKRPDEPYPRLCTR